MKLVEDVYRVTAGLPASEKWGLVDQMRRAAISVPSNIAEGFGRAATGEYRHHLLIARGSLLELQTQALLCERLGFLDNEISTQLYQRMEVLGKMLSTLIGRLR